MAVFSNYAPGLVEDAARLARASYAGEPTPGNWRALSGSDISFDPGLLGGLFSGTMAGTTFLTGVDFFLGIPYPASIGSGAAQVYRGGPDGSRLVVSFRGTDFSVLGFGPDALTYSELISNTYVNGFSRFLEAVASYAQANGIAAQNVLITGHSLGAAAVNQLRDKSSMAADSFPNRHSLVSLHRVLQEAAIFLMLDSIMT